ncbi:hypothetical protein EW145_g5505 [Phellinidium pouzarii]|uniref:Uncharacterized protein n=1 Tax=Phellinidium pouzarii TaxID=167371 RepID=A0A4S4KZR8_9AGAM|nr:hypothetical protein EW145_g5505 [Phellinidium pouzarii]
MSVTPAPETASDRSTPAPPVAASPSPGTSTPSSSKSSSHKPKPVNIFSDDGSFLERFQRVKRVPCPSFAFNFEWYIRTFLMLEKLSLRDALAGGRREEEAILTFVLTDSVPSNRSKRTFETRFKNRGKRRAPSSEPSPEGPERQTDSPADDVSPKKMKIEERKPMTAYEEEVKSYSGSLKDDGMGIRPLLALVTLVQPLEPLEQRVLQHDDIARHHLRVALVYGAGGLEVDEVSIGVSRGLARDDGGGDLARDGEDETRVCAVADEHAAGFVVQRDRGVGDEHADAAPEVEQLRDAGTHSV